MVARASRVIAGFIARYLVNGSADLLTKPGAGHCFFAFLEYQKCKNAMTGTGRSSRNGDHGAMAASHLLRFENHAV
jgi:hypothetical protein